MLDRARKYQFGSWRLDTGDRQLTFAGTPIHLTPKTFDLLAILVEAGGRLVDFGEIFGRVWPNVVVERSNAHQTIAVLRRKLKCFDENELIEMVTGRGYRFLGDVHLVDQDSAAPRSGSSSGIISHAASSAVDISDSKVCSEAREYYSKGFHFFERWSGASARSDVETAAALFREAQRIEPKWMAAGSKLAYCCAIQALFFDEDDVLQHEAHLAVQRLLEKGPSNAEAHVVRSEILWSPMGKFQTVAAAQQLIFANREKPDDSSAELGIICAHQGFADVAMLNLNRAVETDRASLRKRSLLAEGCIWVRKLDEALSLYDQLIELDPYNPGHYVFSALACLYSGNTTGAAWRNERALCIKPSDPIARSTRAVLIALTGDIDTALAEVRYLAAPALQIRSGHHISYNIATLHAIRGDVTSAVRWLTKVVDCGMCNPPLLKHDPHLERISLRHEFRDFVNDVHSRWTTLRIDLRNLGNSRM